MIEDCGAADLAPRDAVSEMVRIATAREWSSAGEAEFRRLSELIAGDEITALASARALVAGGAVAERTVAAELLRAIGEQDSYADVVEFVRLLSDALGAVDGVNGDDAANIDLARTVADALSTLFDRRVIPLAIELSAHTDAAVRQRAARALSSGLCSNEGDVGALSALERLSEDVDAEVRDWATFELATLESDHPLIRAALVRRLDDPDLDVRAEAILGLVRRGDVRARGPLERELRLGPDHVGPLLLDAAAELADPGLVSLLDELDASFPIDDRRRERLARALARCRPPA